MVGGSKPGTHHGLEQGGLAVGASAQHLQVSSSHPEAGELSAGLDDLAVGVVVELRALELSGWTSRQSSRSLTRSGRTPVTSTSSSRDIREPLPASTVAARRSAAPVRSSRAPAASSWRITRSGRNSSRCIRRIDRSRSTSAWL